MVLMAKSMSKLIQGMSGTLVVNEIYLSLQGESTFAGLPCIFVRLTACNLRCSYCDTAYAFTEGTKRSLDEIVAEVNRLAEPFAVQQSKSATLNHCASVGGPTAACNGETPGTAH